MGSSMGTPSAKSAVPFRASEDGVEKMTTKRWKEINKMKKGISGLFLRPSGPELICKTTSTRQWIAMAAKSARGTTSRHILAFARRQAAGEIDGIDSTMP